MNGLAKRGAGWIAIKLTGQIPGGDKLRELLQIDEVALVEIVVIPSMGIILVSLSRDANLAVGERRVLEWVASTAPNSPS